jgi:hypothetical protein
VLVEIRKQMALMLDEPVECSGIKLVSIASLTWRQPSKDDYSSFIYNKD